MLCRLASLRLRIVVEKEVSVVELHLEDRQRTNAWSLLASCDLGVLRAWCTVYYASKGWRLGGSHFRAVRELTVRGLTLLHSFVAIGLALDDLLAASLKRITAKALATSAEVSCSGCIVGVELVVAVDAVLLIEPLLALMAAASVFGLEYVREPPVAASEMAAMGSVGCVNMHVMSCW